MNPYPLVAEATQNNESLLVLCCGIGRELHGVTTPNITAVDISPQYIEVLKSKYPDIKAINSSAIDYLKTQPDQSVDVISFMDGLEHMTKEEGLEALKEIKRVGKKIILFLPEGMNDTGYLRNEPHNAWGVEGADEYQTHKSGWKRDEIIDLGFNLIRESTEISQHGEPYYALLFGR